MPTAPKSLTRQRTQSGSAPHSTDAPIVPSRIANYPAFDPYAFLNTSIESSSSNLPGPLPATRQDVNSFTNHIHGDSSYAGFPTIPTHSPHQSHVALWPLIPQQFVPIVPSSVPPPEFAASLPQGQMLYPAIDSSSSRPNQPPAPVASTSQIMSPNAAQRNASVDPEDAAVLEDKRRRNTVASARFRIKKKQRNLNLERAVSDLTSRAEELEREAINLRRENGWLKEMVIMRGQQNFLRSPDGALSDTGESSDGTTGCDAGTSRNLDTKQLGEGKKVRWNRAKTTGEGKEKGVRRKSKEA